MSRSESAAKIDPVVARRRVAARWAGLGKRIGYLLYGVAMVLFFIALATNLPNALVTGVVVCMALGSVVLAPAIVVGYGVNRPTERTANGLPLGNTARIRSSVSTRLSAAERRHQLVEVALQVFAERGFHATSMSDIAVTAGVTKPVLYQHFGSKRQLYAELLTEVGEQLQDAIVKAVASAASPREMVEEGFAAYFRFVDAHRHAFQLFYATSSWRDPEFSALVHNVENALAEQVANFIEIEGLTAEQRRLLGHGIVGMVEGASTHWLLAQDDADPGELTRQLADLAWRGLRGVEVPSTPRS